jgi:hypothetical protein
MRDLSRLMAGEEARFAARECKDFAVRIVRYKVTKNIS